MSESLILSILGIAGTLLGTGLGSFLQWKFNKNAERKEIKRLLISVMANMQPVLMELTTAMTLCRLRSFKWNYNLRIIMEYRDGNGASFPNYVPHEIPVNEMQSEFMLELNKLTTSISQLKRYFTEFNLYLPNETLSELVTKIDNYPPDYFKKFLQDSTSSSKDIDFDSAYRKSVEPVVKEFNPVIEQFENEMMRVIKNLK